MAVAAEAEIEGEAGQLSSKLGKPLESPAQSQIPIIAVDGPTRGGSELTADVKRRNAYRVGDLVEGYARGEIEEQNRLYLLYDVVQWSGRGAAPNRIYAPEISARS